MKAYFKGSDEMYKYIEYPDLGHEVSPKMYDELILWFKKHLQDKQK